MPRPVTKDHRAFTNALTVAELIKHLEELPSDAFVCFVCPYGDYSNTSQALPVKSAHELERDEYLGETGYSQSGLALYQHDEDEEDVYHDNDVCPVIILR